MVERREITNKMILNIAVVTMVLLFLMWFLIGVLQQQKSRYEYTLDSGWTVFKNGQVLSENIPVEDISFGEVLIGDELDLYIDLPEYLDGGYTFELLVYLCSVEAYIDEELIYSYGAELIGKNVMIGSGYHFINLPDEVSGKTLHISMIVNENNAFTSISEPKCAKSEYSIISFAKTHLANLLICMFLLGLGMILFSVSIVAVFYDKVYKRLIYIGIFSIFLGLYTLLSTKASQVFMVDFVHATELEYISLYFAPVPFTYLMSNMRDSGENWRSITIKVICGVLTTFSVVAVVLHYTNVLRFPVVLPFFHIVAFVCMVTIIVVGGFSVRHYSRAESLTAIAMVMLMIVLGLDICRFNLQKYLFPNVSFLMNSFIPLGTMIFVIMLLVSYLMYLYDMVMTKTEKDTLMRLAYHDVLTGLYNRAKYELMMAELDESKKEFALISIDLNDLKYVNDTYGHNKGDLMLTTFAYILKKNFDSIGECFRTGGDEYIVIIDEHNISKISQAVINLTADQQKESEANIFDIRASYGIAYRSEIDDGQAFKVFRLADRRMYEMKSQSKGKEYVFGKM